jgi:hypothetical protein
MNMHNINNEKILEKLRFIIVCDNDDFLSNAFNFLILEDCINIAFSCDDLESLEILKTFINPFIKNLIKINDFLCYKVKLTDIYLNQLSESDQELYQYKFNQLVENKDPYLLAFKQLLK